MFDLIQVIMNSIPFKIVGLGIILWSFFTLIAHPDRMLIDVVMQKKKARYDETKE